MLANYENTLETLTAKSFKTARSAPDIAEGIVYIQS